MYAQAYYHTQSPSGQGSHRSQSPHVPGPAGATADPVFINRRIYFSSGQFTGQTIRYELKEIQKASLGRKYARVDRRPLDPPPVVLVKIWRYSPETGQEEEYNYEDVQTHGLLCTVDLFPVPAKTSKDSPTSTATSSRSQKTTQTSDGFVHFNPSGPSAIQSLTSSPPYRPQSYGPSDIVHYYDGIYALLESSKNTHSLVGATFVQPVLVEISGEKCIVFVFSDLAVKTEGTFTLRYRIFDLFSPTPDPRGSQSPPSTTYPATPNSLSISPTLSNAAPSPPPTALGSVTSTQSTTLSTPQFASAPRPPHIYLQQPSQPPVTNPYPDPYQGYIAPPTLPSQPRRRLTESEETPPDFQAQFAPHDSHPRIEPQDRGSTLSILGECWAKGAFRIYSTKEFPGLPASTELTKHLARWGVRLNIRETERRRRRRSTVEDEDEYHSDGPAADIGDGSGSTKEQQLPPRKAAAIKPKPQTQMQIQTQAKSSLSLTRAAQAKRSSPSSPTSTRFGNQRQHWSNFEGDDDEELEIKPDASSHNAMVEFDDNRLRNHPPRPTGLAGFSNFTYSHPNPATNGFDPSPTRAHSYATEQAQAQIGHDMSSQPYTGYAHSNVRSSITGANMFSSQSPSNVPFSRYASARKRDSDGSSTSGRSAGSIEESRMQGMGPSYTFDASQGLNGLS